jgi:uncharacterized protein YgbK (DUF1537 family)
MKALTTSKQQTTVLIGSISPFTLYQVSVTGTS